MIVKRIKQCFQLEHFFLSLHPYTADGAGSDGLLGVGVAIGAAGLVYTSLSSRLSKLEGGGSSSGKKPVTKAGRCKLDPGLKATGFKV